MGEATFRKQKHAVKFQFHSAPGRNSSSRKGLRKWLSRLSSQNIICYCCRCRSRHATGDVAATDIRRLMTRTPQLFFEKHGKVPGMTVRVPYFGENPYGH